MIRGVLFGKDTKGLPAVRFVYTCNISVVDTR